MYTATNMVGGNHDTHIVRVTFDKRLTWKPHIAHVEGRIDAS